MAAIRSVFGVSFRLVGNFGHTPAPAAEVAHSHKVVGSRPEQQLPGTLLVADQPRPLQSALGFQRPE